MKNRNSLGNFKYKYRFFFTLDYLLKKIGINFTQAYIHSIKLDDFVLEELRTDNFIIKECTIDDLHLFGELKDLFLRDMQDDHILIAAFLGDEWVGYNWISLKPIEVEEVERVIHFNGAYLYRAYVKKEYRQMGIMKKIVYLTLNQIKNKYNENEVYVITENVNIPSIKTYANSGFSVMGTIGYSKFFLWKKFEANIDDNSVVFLED